MKNLLIILLYFSCTVTTLLAQSGRHAHNCGVHISDDEVNQLEQLLNRLRLKEKIRTTTDLGNFDPLSLPLSIFIVRKSDGTGDDVPMSTIQKNIDQLNNSYAPINISFAQCGNIRYVNNDDYYIGGTSKGEQMNEEHGISGSINVFFVKGITGGFIGGYTQGPGAGDFIVMHSGHAAISDKTMSHEMGHFFGLHHTFGIYIDSDRLTDELVDGSNCETTGDRICDTPADPNDETYDGDECFNLRYIGDRRDANGDKYEPDFHNYMSYYNVSECPYQFSTEQYLRMRTIADNVRNYFSCAGEPCNVGATESVINVDASFHNGTNRFDIRTRSECSYLISNSCDWIELKYNRQDVSNTTQTGPLYEIIPVIQPNPTQSPRTCEIVIGSRTLTINQEGADECKLCPLFDDQISPTESWQVVEASYGAAGCHIIKIDAQAGKKYTFKTRCGDGTYSDFFNNIDLYNSSCQLIEDVERPHCSNPHVSYTIEYAFNQDQTVYLKSTGHLDGGGTVGIAYKAENFTCDPIVSIQNNGEADHNSQTLSVTLSELNNACSWRASENENALRLTRTSGSGNANFLAILSRNNSILARELKFFVNDMPYTISQAGRPVACTDCVVKVANPSAEYTGGGCYRFSWDECEEFDLDYSLRYRIVGTTNWIEKNLQNNPYVIGGFDICADYEGEIYTTCEGVEYASTRFLFSNPDADQQDLVFDQLISPSKFKGRYQTSSNLSSSNLVSIKIENNGAERIRNATFNYSVDGQLIRRKEHTNLNIPSGGSMTYSFDKRVSMHQPGEHELRVWFTSNEDCDETNNEITKSYLNKVNHYVTIPYSENFLSSEEHRLNQSEIVLDDAEDFDFNLSAGATASVKYGHFNFLGDVTDDLFQMIQYQDNGSADLTWNLDMRRYTYSAEDIYIGVVLDPSIDAVGQYGNPHRQFCVRGNSSESWICIPYPRVGSPNTMPPVVPSKTLEEVEEILGYSYNAKLPISVDVPDPSLGPTSCVSEYGDAKINISEMLSNRGQRFGKTFQMKLVTGNVPKICDYQTDYPFVIKDIIIGNIAHVVTPVAGKKGDEPSLQEINLDFEVFAVYPNPFTNEMNIELPIEQDVNSIKVVNNIGQEVHEIVPVNDELNYQFNTRNWSKGMYTIVIQNSDGTISHAQMIKE